VVGGRGGTERDASTEPSGDGIGVGDGARCGHWPIEVHFKDRAVVLGFGIILLGFRFCGYLSFFSW